MIKSTPDDICMPHSIQSSSSFSSPCSPVSFAAFLLLVQWSQDAGDESIANVAAIAGGDNVRDRGGGAGLGCGRCRASWLAVLTSISASAVCAAPVRVKELLEAAPDPAHSLLDRSLRGCQLLESGGTGAVVEGAGGLGVMTSSWIDVADQWFWRWTLCVGWSRSQPALSPQTLDLPTSVVPTSSLPSKSLATRLVSRPPYASAVSCIGGM